MIIRRNIYIYIHLFVHTNRINISNFWVEIEINFVENNNLLIVTRRSRDNYFIFLSHFVSSKAAFKHFTISNMNLLERC